MYKNIYHAVYLLTFTLSYHNVAQANYNTLFSFGYGTGNTKTRGGITTDKSTRVLSAAWDYHDGTGFAYLGGISGDKSEHHGLKIIVGGGNKYFKIGSGIHFMATDLPTELRSWGLFNANPQFKTEANIVGVPLYFRYTPLSSEKWQVHLDGFYTLVSSGELKIPIRGTGHPNGNLYLVTDKLKTQGSKGGAFTLNYRLGKEWALQLRYSIESAHINDNDAVIPYDPFSAIKPTPISAFDFENETLTLNMVWLLG